MTLDWPTAFVMTVCILCATAIVFAMLGSQAQERKRQETKDKNHGG